MKIKIFSLVDEGGENYRPDKTEYTLRVNPDGVDILDE
jgi:hypothetical protein